MNYQSIQCSNWFRYQVKFISRLAEFEWKPFSNSVFIFLFLIFDTFTENTERNSENEMGKNQNTGREEGGGGGGNDPL